MTDSMPPVVLALKMIHASLVGDDELFAAAVSRQCPCPVCVIVQYRTLAHLATVFILHGSHRCQRDDPHEQMHRAATERVESMLGAFSGEGEA